MKIQNLLLCASLVFGAVVSQEVNEPKNSEDFKYNFHCLEDNKGVCKFLEAELSQAVNSISDIVDFETTVTFEAFVDDLSKYRINKKKETLAIALDNEFKPLNTMDTTKDNNIKSPYPNSKTLLKRIDSENKNNDFILVLNNFKSDPKYLKRIQSDFDSSIIMEIFDGLKTLQKVGPPYSSSKPLMAGPKVKNMDFDMEGYLPKRKDKERMDADAARYTDKCLDFINFEKLHTIIHWEDTLITKEKSIGKKVGKRVGNPKNHCHIVQRNKYERIVVVGDIHGDYDHLIKILRHAKLIDKDNNWIGTDAILVQMGDLVDRGDDGLQAYEIMFKLREQAQKKGGIVYILIGNHEIYAIEGNHYFTSLKDYENFGGLDKREEAFGPNGKIGKMIREEFNMTMVIDDSLYVHAGLSPDFAKLGVDTINKKAREILMDTPIVEDLYQMYIQKNITHPIYTDPLFREDIGVGPVEYRNFASEPEEKICADVEETLRLTNTKRMIIGHTPQSYGKIRTKCQNKVIIVDIGISRCIGGGYNGYLEILNKKQEIWARYLEDNN